MQLSEWLNNSSVNGFVLLCEPISCSAGMAWIQLVAYFLAQHGTAHGTGIKYKGWKEF